MMKTYLISYDLIYPESSIQNAALIRIIKSATYWAKPLKSAWLIKTTLGPMEILNQLRKTANFKDKILVIEVSNSWASINLPNDVINWMKGGI